MITAGWGNIKNKLFNTETLFMTGLFLYLVQSFLSRTTFSVGIHTESMYQLIRYVSYALCILSVCTKTISERYLITAVIVLGISLIIAFKTTDKTILFMAIVALAGYQQDYKKILKMSFIVYAVLLVLTVIFSHTGIIDNYVSDLLTRQRDFFGFTWATIPQTYMLFITILYVCIREDQITYLEMILLFLISSWFFRYTDARFVYLITVLFLICTVIIKQFHIQKIQSKGFRKFLLWVPVILCILTITMYCLYNPENETWQAINRALSTRMQLGYDVLSRYGISLCGKHIVLKGHSVNSVALDDSLYNYVDSSYLQITLLYGIAGMGMMIAGVTYLIWHCLKYNRMYLLAAVLCILLLSITEDVLLKMGMNLFVLIFSDMHISQDMDK